MQNPGRMSKKCIRHFFEGLHSLTGRAINGSPGRSFVLGSDFASKIARKSPHMSPIFDVESKGLRALRRLPWFLLDCPGGMRILPGFLHQRNDFFPPSASPQMPIVVSPAESDQIPSLTAASIHDKILSIEISGGVCHHVLKSRDLFRSPVPAEAVFLCGRGEV